MKVQLYYQKAVVLKIVDGDTIHLSVDWGNKIKTEPEELRMYGINTPETHQRKPGLTDEAWKAEKEAGKKATARLSELVAGKTVLIRTVKYKDPKEKYGRLLAEVRLITKVNDDGTVEASDKTIAEMLIEEKLGVPYFGGTR